MFNPTHLSPHNKPIQVVYSACYKYPTMVPYVVYETADGWTQCVTLEEFDKYDKKTKSREWKVLTE